MRCNAVLAWVLATQAVPGADDAEWPEVDEQVDEQVDPVPQPRSPDWTWVAGRL
ncbi:hypothetical protein ACOBQX_19760 [Actinokineospora sp. G85]|uniref:hypothetical protein n=1 Tax=Actinokineospora sp. G85 TaxID=3406626 RepID=UPI003C72C86E